MSANYALKHPVTLTFNRGKEDEREEQLTEVVVRRPKAKDLRLADSPGGAIANELKLIAQLTGIDVKVVDEFDADDIAGIQKVIEGFSAPGQETGGTS